MFSINFNQLFIEGENNQVFVYVYLNNLCTRDALKVLDRYVKNYKNYDFVKINILFVNVLIPGEHLSTYRKTKCDAIRRILKGFKLIEGHFDYSRNEKVINEAQLIC